MIMIIMIKKRMTKNDPNFVPYNSTESKYNESADFVI